MHENGNRMWRTLPEWASQVAAASVDAGVTPWKRTDVGYKESTITHAAQMSLEAGPHESRKRAGSFVREYAPSIQARRAARVVRVLGQKLSSDMRIAWAVQALKRLESTQ